MRACGVPLSASVEGVRQDNFEELERTLVALTGEYLSAQQSGDADLARSCRKAVIAGKEHALLAARRADASDSRRALKQEMAQWMLLWLENPALFPAWVALRKKAGCTPA